MVGVIIQARMGSTRLPGKSLSDICGNPLLYYSSARASLAKYPEKVVIATTVKQEDDAIYKWCITNNYTCFRGSELDVLDRYYTCAKQYGFDIIVRVTADDPFIDFAVIDMLITSLKAYGKDYVTMRNKTNTWPYGLDVEAITFTALEKAWKESTIKYHREHVTTYIKDNTSLFNVLEIPLDKEIADVRLTVDTKEDFSNASILLDKLIKNHGITYSWHDVYSEYMRTIKKSET